VRNDSTGHYSKAMRLTTGGRATTLLPPRWAVVGWFIFVLFLAGYYVWRANHIRMIPKFKILDVVHCQETATEQPEEMKLYVQIVPQCLTDAAVEKCRGHLLRVHKRHTDDGEWILTQMNEPLFGDGKNYDEDKDFKDIASSQHTLPQIISYQTRPVAFCGQSVVEPGSAVAARSPQTC
jgi:hypothetical protein